MNKKKAASTRTAPKKNNDTPLSHDSKKRVKTPEKKAATSGARPRPFKGCPVNLGIIKDADGNAWGIYTSRRKLRPQFPNYRVRVGLGRAIEIRGEKNRLHLLWLPREDRFVPTSEYRIMAERFPELERKAAETVMAFREDAGLDQVDEYEDEGSGYGW